MQIKDKPFQWLVKFLENKKIKVIKTPIQWKNKTLSENSNEFIGFFNKHKTEENYILGFSYGAVITLLTASKTKPEKIYLCSLSPDFIEDRDVMIPRQKKYIGKKRFADTATRSGIDLAKNLKIPTVVFYGEKEGKDYLQLKKRCQETVQLAQNAKLIVVKNSPHKIDFPEYIEEIEQELSEI